jgi:hypothetical protein
MAKVNTKLLFNIVSKIMGIASLVYSLHNIIDNWKHLDRFNKSISIVQIITSVMMIIGVYTQHASIVSLTLTIYGFLFI